MNSLMEDITLFYRYSRLAKETIRKYSYRLKYFSSYLSNLMDSDIMDIYLDKVYIEKDSLGVVIRYLPIDAALIDEYFNLLIPRGFYTLRDHHTALNSFFRFLEKNSNFQNPFDKIEFNLNDHYPKKKYSAILTRSGILKFLNSLIVNSKDLKTDLLLFSILISTGCRISEILDLQAEDIDVENDSFKLKKTKNKSQRIVNMRAGMGNILNQYCFERNRGPLDCIFLNNNMKKFSRTDVNTLLNNYLLLAGLPPLNIHGLRHTFATLMADEETPIILIQQLLGHKSIKSTMGYINPHYVRNKNFNMPENKIVLKGLKEILVGKKIQYNLEIGKSN